MTIIRLRFRDMDDQVLGDLEVSRDVQIGNLLPLILEQLGLERQRNWHLVLDRVIDPQCTFTEAGARDGSVIRVVAKSGTIPLTQEIQLTISDPEPIADDVPATCIWDRKQEINAIARDIKQQRHILISGAPGIGKSHLLRYARDYLIAPDASIYLDDFKSASAALRQIACALYQRRQLARLRGERHDKAVYRELERQRPQELVKLVCDSLRGRGYVLVIDDLDTIAPDGLAALKDLGQVATLLAAARTDRLPRLDSIAEQFDCIQLGPLPDDAACSMFWSRLGYSLPEPDKLENRVRDAARGNPGKIASMATRYRRSNVLNPVWILLIAAALTLAFYFASRQVGAASATIVAGGLCAVFVAARAFLWRAT
jgi:hypothetical protein